MLVHKGTAIYKTLNNASLESASNNFIQITGEVRKLAIQCEDVKFNINVYVTPQKQGYIILGRDVIKAYPTQQIKHNQRG